MKDDYTRYCITPEAKEYLRKMLEEKSDVKQNLSDDLKDFEDLEIFDEEDNNEEIENDEFFRFNEARNDDDYDFWKETL